MIIIECINAYLIFNSQIIDKILHMNLYPYWVIMLVNNHNIVEHYQFNNGALVALLVVSMGIIVKN